MAPGRRYRVLMELGRGGMGVARLAMSRGPRGFVKLIVLKSLHPELVHDEGSQARLLEEARIAARLSHPNVVQVFEVIALHDAPTIVMEYVEGQSLWTVSEECLARLPLALHLHVLAQVLSGLHAAHTLRDFDGAPLELVHRDVSPHNVLLGYDGQVKVLDFGIATTAASAAEARPGVARGKLLYMAPEQLGGARVDRRADVFAVGVMLYEAVAGQRFWGEAAEGEVARRLLERDLPRLERADLAASLRALVNRAIAPEPEQRHASAEELQQALELELAGQAPSALREQLATFLGQHFRQARRTMQDLVRSHVSLASEPPPALDPPGSPGSSAARAPRMTPRRLLAALVLSAAAGLVALTIGEADTPEWASPSASSCAAGQKHCDGACVSSDRPEYGCAAPGCRPCLVPSATPRCDLEQRCAIAVCHPDHDDCDGDARNGCETALRLDPEHCGGCGLACARGEPCASGRCAR